MTNTKRRDEPETDGSDEQVTPQLPSLEPSWFFEGDNQPTREQLIARYRKHFNLPEDDALRVPHRQSRGHAPGYRDLIETPRGMRHALFMDNAPDERRPGTPGEAGESASSPGLRKVYMLAALGAVLAGGSVGFLASLAHNVELGPLVASGDVLPADDPPRNVASALPDGPGAVVKKAVATASLQVEDVSGAINSFIPLALHAEPGAVQQDLLLKLSGLPDGAYLTSGHRQADKVWSLSLDDLKDVKLMVPGPGQPEINVDVSAVERNSGELAAPVKSMTIALSGAMIVPVSSPPPGSRPAMAEAARTDMPAPIPVPMNTGVTLASVQNSVRELIAQGDARLKAGDAVAARQFYGRAWSNGLPEGAMSMARTFDPLQQASLHLSSAALDAAQALQWYERAARAGQQEAFAAIERLRAKP